MAGTLKVKSAPKTSSQYFTNRERNLLSLTHELSGPLTAAKLNLERYRSEESVSSLKMLASNLKLMEDYLTTAREQIKYKSAPARFFSVNKQITDIIKTLSPQANQQSIKIKFSPSNDYYLIGNSTSFKQIISCVIRNAIDAYESNFDQDKPIIIAHSYNNDYLIISVEDYGNGIALENKAKIFKPFFSTKKSTAGLGLGLSLVAESIAQDFNGFVKLLSIRSSGTNIRLYFDLIKSGGSALTKRTPYPKIKSSSRL